MGKINKGLMSSATGEHSTPDDLFDTLNRIYNFTLDAAASKDNAKCKHYYTREYDALSKPWYLHVIKYGGAVWLNPPYGKEIGDFMEKAHLEHLNGCTVVCLVPARTDTKWFHEWAMKGDVIFLRGRLKFSGLGSAPFPSALVIYDGLTGKTIGDRDFMGIGQHLEADDHG